MTVSVLLALLACLPPALAQDEEPLPEPVVAALADLDQAYRSHNDGIIVGALRRAAEVRHPAVVARIGEALDSRKSGVRRTAITILAELDEDAARIALERFWRTSKRLDGDPELAERTLRAIGKHGCPDSFPIFAEVRWVRVEEGREVPERIELLRAKVRGLGRIREKRAVARLLELFEEMPPASAELRADFRLSLLVLTGQDYDDSFTRWKRWWQEAAETFALPEELPELAVADKLEWVEYWGLPIDVEMSDELRERRERRRGGGR